MHRKLLLLFLATITIHAFAQLPPATQQAIQEYSRNLPHLLCDLQARKLTPDFQKLMSKILIYNHLDRFPLSSKTLNWHSGIRSFSFSYPGGKYVAIIPHIDADGHNDGKTVYIVNAYSAHPEYKILRHNHTIATVLLSPDAKHILTYGHEDGSCLWSLDNLENGPKNIYKGNDVTALAFSANGRLLLLGCHKIAYLWNMTNLQLPPVFLNHKALLKDPANKPSHSITAVACSPNGKYLLIGSSEGLLYLWDTTCLQEWPKLLGNDGYFAQFGVNFIGHDREITSIAFSSDSRYALTGSADNTACLWDITKPAAAPRILEHSSRVNAVAISQCGNYALTGSDDNKARLWNLYSCTMSPLVLEHNEPVTLVACISPDSGYAVTSCNAHSTESVYLWHLGDWDNYTLEKIIAILQQSKAHCSGDTTTS